MAGQFRILRIGPGLESSGDPMEILQKELALHQYVKIPEVPVFTGGAIGYVAYDAL